MNFATITSNLTRRARTALLVGCSLAGTLGVAQAATPNDSVSLDDAVPSAVVNYGDLNLATEAGARTLYQRLAVAAKQVCPIEEARSLGEVAQSHACRAEAIARAVRQVNSPQLAALSAARTNRG
jgi:UrcA family protein